MTPLLGDEYDLIGELRGPTAAEWSQLQGTACMLLDDFRRACPDADVSRTEKNVLSFCRCPMPHDAKGWQSALMNVGKIAVGIYDLRDKAKNKR